MKNKIFSLLLVLLFLFGLSLLVKNQEGYLYIEDRPKTNFSDISNNISVDTINSIFGDQMKYRDIILEKFLQIFDRFSMGDKVVCYNREQIKINGIFYDNSYNRVDASLFNTCANKAFNINEISSNYSSIKTYVYNPIRYLNEPILDSIWFPNNYEEYEKIFLSYVGDKVKYKKMNYYDEEIDEYFYKTDLHYNVFGADKAYQEIVNMINEDIDIGSPKKLIRTKEINNKFRGSYSRSCENLDDIYDTLCVGVYDIDNKNYDYYSNGELSNFSNNKNAMTSDDYNNAHAYEIFFNVNTGENIFDYKDPSKKNILIITDSYIGPIKEVLSSHFNKAIIISGDYGIRKLSLDKTIKENDVDIILFLWFQQNLYYNGYYFVPIN